MPAPTPEIGSTANRYEILGKLAEGGMAEIFLARGATAAGIERHVVLKRILRERAGDAAFVRMFLDEARLAAQLQHPNVAQVYDVGRLGESYFFTMEYVHGETVRALIKRARATGFSTPIACVLAIAAGAAAGLHHAHERRGANGHPLGIVHRDVSPSNLMVTYEGHVKVVDFGVAKAAGRANQTVSGTLKGKIAYLSPEQCRNIGVDRRSDLFALGVVMWELLVGEYLYRRDSDFLAMTAIVEETTPLASSRRRDVPPELDALVARLLQKDPNARFQTGGELVDALEQVAEHLGASLTASRLARFMRESFGDRPEPWVELATAGGSPSVITVNSDLVASPVIDDVLRAVPTLPPTEALDGDDLKQTLVLDSTGPQPAIEAPKHPTLPTTVDRPPAPPRRSPSSRGVVVAIALVVIVGAAVGVLAMTRGGGTRPPTAKPPADAAAQAVIVLPVVDAAPSRPAPIDAAQAPPPIDAPPPIVHPIAHRRPHGRPLPPPQPGSAAEPTPAPGPTPAPPDAASDDCGGNPMACQH